MCRFAPDWCDPKKMTKSRKTRTAKHKGKKNPPVNEEQHSKAQKQEFPPECLDGSFKFQRKLMLQSQLLHDLRLRSDKQDKESPCCKWCGSKDKKTEVCSECLCVSYCSRECQKKDWKRGDHATLCKELKKDAMKQAKEIVEILNDPNGRISEDISLLERSLRVLNDHYGVYSFANEHGLSEALYSCVTFDLMNLDRFFSGTKTPFAFSITISEILFQRADNRIDGFRFDNYMSHRQDAFLEWFYSVQLSIYLVFTRKAYVDAEFHLATFKLARAGLNALHNVWNNKRTSRAILETRKRFSVADHTQGSDMMVSSLAKYTKESLTACLRPENNCMDFDGLLEGSLKGLLAKILLRCQDFGIKNAALDRVVNEVQRRDSAFGSLIIPVARASLAKGDHLTANEFHSAFGRASPPQDGQDDAENAH